MFCFTVTVNVWFCPTSLVAVGAIEMFASTYVLVAGPLPPGPAGMFAVAGLVSRERTTPPMVSVTDALPTTLPPDGLLNVTEHFPLAVPTPAQLSVTSTTAAPLDAVRVTVGLVPSGTLTNPLPAPPFCFTVTLKVWLTPTSFVAFGPIVICASTNVFVTGPDP